MIDIQEITLKHTDKGVTQEWVYLQLIKPQYHISRRTYYEYMATNAKKELKDLDRCEQEDKRQLKMF